MVRYKHNALSANLQLATALGVIALAGLMLKKRKANLAGVEI